MGHFAYEKHARPHDEAKASACAKKLPPIGPHESSERDNYGIGFEGCSSLEEGGEHLPSLPCGELPRLERRTLHTRG